ncbi:phosphopentomutase [Rhodanobacter soli]|uniref:phosphopentomutase n=1 Tax=Rhodanobacter soli TaxID=590609 RepID=UPI0031DB0C44
MTRAVWLVLDSLGLGAAPDAADYGDAGADTFGHIAAACAAAARGPLRLPNFTRLGLPQAHAAAHGQAAPGFEMLPAAEGLWGYAVERARGKDTPSGHWETAGVVLTEPFGVFGQAEPSFPPALLQALVERGGLPGVLGNCHASGTEIIQRLGAEHVRSGRPIVYTSADSVFQIAAHEQAFGLDRLYRLCELARGLLADYNIGRVIARPFTGSAKSGFSRSPHRRDYALPPPAPTLFDTLLAAGGEVVAIGKIGDIFAHRGVSRCIEAHGHDELFDATLAAIAQAGSGSLVATNFVDFDMVYGHRRDVFGYAAALEALDARLPELLRALRPGDLLAISADHGCDPTWPGSDHTRECVPALVFGPGLAPRSLGRCDSFADIGQSLAVHLGLPALAAGRSFLLPT